MDSAIYGEEPFYHKEEHFDAERTKELSYHYHEILRLLGEDVEREGLLQTPLRVPHAGIPTESGGNPAVGSVQGGLPADGHREGH